MDAGGRATHGAVAEGLEENHPESVLIFSWNGTLVYDPYV
jgi:hypothetical protein